MEITLEKKQQRQQRYNNYELTGRDKFIYDLMLQYFKTNEQTINFITRAREIREVRQVMHFFLKKETKLPLSLIGCKIGKKDHATVSHSCKIIQDLLDSKDKKITMYVSDIEELINVMDKSSPYVNLINKIKLEKETYLKTWEHVQYIKMDIGLSDATMDEMKAKISSKIAQCDLSIRSHKLEQTSETSKLHNVIFANSEPNHHGD